MAQYKTSSVGLACGLFRRVEDHNSSARTTIATSDPTAINQGVAREPRRNGWVFTMIYPGRVGQGVRQASRFCSVTQVRGLLCRVVYASCLRRWFLRSSSHPARARFSDLPL